MKFLKSILVLIAVTSSLFGVAQNGDGFGFGVRAGLNLADYSGSTGTSRLGFAGGVFGDYTIKRFGLEAGVYYSEQGSLDVITQGVYSFKSDYRFDYVSIQLLAKYQIFNGFRIFAGPEGGYLIKSTKSYIEDQTVGRVTDKLNNINKWDLGVVAGVGYTFSFGLDLSASYSRGFLNLFQDATQKKGYTSMFRVTVGWHF